MSWPFLLSHTWETIALKEFKVIAFADLVCYILSNRTSSIVTGPGCSPKTVIDGGIVVCLSSILW